MFNDDKRNMVKKKMRTTKGKTVENESAREFENTKSEGTRSVVGKVQVTDK